MMSWKMLLLKNPAPHPAKSYLLRRQSAGPISTDGSSAQTGDWRKAAEGHPEDLVLESWAQGFIVGALIIMACITIANMRKGVLLHKLIFLELLLAMTHGTFCFMSFNGYGWYLSSTAALLYISWIIHNIVAWMKVKPFFTQPGGFFKVKVGLWVRRVYLVTLAMTVPVILFQITDNFRYFNNRGGWYTKLRPYEPLYRDPWWVFTCIALLHVVRKCYSTGVFSLVNRSPRFGILLSAIILSVVFTILDIVASIHSFTSTVTGINPWWKLSLVFKCLTDTIMLDDFKTELKRLGIRRIEKEEARRNSTALATEYMEGPNGTDYSHPRRDTLYPSKHNAIQSRNFSSESTVRQPERKDLRDDNEDPLSEYAAQRESQTNTHSYQAHKRSSGSTTNNNPDAELEEVEFATALSSDPSHVSGVESVNGGNRQTNERTNIRNSTKRIARLPGLREFKFEAIKPGGKSSNRHPETSDNDSDGDGGTGTGSSTFTARTFAEEINRNTIMDLEAQKREKEAKGGKKKWKWQKEKGHAAEDEAEPEGEDDDEERMRRFRQSIGAAS